MNDNQVKDNMCASGSTDGRGKYKGRDGESERERALFVCVCACVGGNRAQGASLFASASIPFVSFNVCILK